MIIQQSPIPYDGRKAFPGAAVGVWTGRRRLQVLLTGLIVTVPFAGLAIAVRMLWGHGVGPVDGLQTLVFYTVTGLGISVGFHRLITHRSFTARPGDPHSPYVHWPDPARRVRQPRTPPDRRGEDGRPERVGQTVPL